MVTDVINIIRENIVLFIPLLFVMIVQIVLDDLSMSLYAPITFFLLT